MSSENIRITRVRAITTAPYGAGLAIVKVETSQLGLYGAGCTTFTQTKRSPVQPYDYNWTQLRKPDGTPVRP